jgi:hypothetical protein
MRKARSLRKNVLAANHLFDSDCDSSSDDARIVKQGIADEGGDKPVSQNRMAFPVIAAYEVSR